MIASIRLPQRSKRPTLLLLISQRQGFSPRTINISPESCALSLLFAGHTWRSRENEKAFLTHFEIMIY